MLKNNQKLPIYFPFSAKSYVLAQDLKLRKAKLPYQTATEMLSNCWLMRTQRSAMPIAKLACEFQYRFFFRSIR